MMQAQGHIDLLIPRGGAGLIQAVVQNSKVPVIETGAGNVHIYVDRTGDQNKAIPIILNAKTQRVGVCNATEKLLVHSDIAEAFLPQIATALAAADVEVHADEQAYEIIDKTGIDGVKLIHATEEDWDTEYLALKIGVKVVDSLDEAISHINRHSTGHTESIIAEDYSAIEEFTSRIDSAVVMVNASTRFTDGGVFGFGAELGISTQKMHARAHGTTRNDHDQVDRLRNRPGTGMNEHNNNDGQMEETMTDAKNPWNADLNDPYLGLKLASERLSIVRYVFLVQIEDGIASAAQRASLEYADAVLIGWPEVDAEDVVELDEEKLKSVDEQMRLMEQYIAKFSAMEREQDIDGMTDTLIRVTERVAEVRRAYQPDSLCRLSRRSGASCRTSGMRIWAKSTRTTHRQRQTASAVRPRTPIRNKKRGCLMTGPKRMRPESAEADSELAISYVVEPERRMSDLSVESAGSAVATGRRSARGNWHSSLASASWAARSTPSTTATWWRPQKCRGCTTSTK